MFNVKSKIWLEQDGELIFGDGRYELLKAIDSEGSINKAAKKIGMPYRRAWGFITAIEERLNIKLVEKMKGGEGGGRSFVTLQGRMLMEKYEEFRKGLNEYVDNKFKEIFGK